MKHLSSLLMAVALAAAVPVFAGDLSYTTLVPQTGDTELVIAHKHSLNLAPRKWSNVTTSGTIAIPAVMLDRVVINSPGTASQVVLTDGTTAIATLATTGQASLPFGIVLASGTLTSVTSGSAPANLTITYR